MLLKHDEKLPPFGWTLGQMLNVPSQDSKTNAKHLGDQSLVGSIIAVAIEEEGAKYVQSKGAYMWFSCLQDLGMPLVDIYNKLRRVGTPHCVVCANYNPPIVDTCECPAVPAKKKRNVGRPTGNVLRQMMRN